MKILFCLILLVKYCHGDDIIPGPVPVPRNIWLGYNFPGQLQDNNITAPKTTEVENDIVQPCSLQDRNCIRQLLTPISGCSPAYGAGRDSSFVKKLPLILPNADSTVVLYDVELRGIHSGNLTQFFTNKKTETLLLEVEFNSLVVYSPRAKFIYHLKGEETVKVTDSFSAEFKQVSLTLTVEANQDEQLIDSNVYGSLLNLDVVIQVGATLGNSQALIAIRKDIGVSAKEALVTIGPVYLAAYLQSRIC